MADHSDRESIIEEAIIEEAIIEEAIIEEAIIEEAIIAFEELSSELSEREGSLTIDPTEKGPVFGVRVEAGRSREIAKMQIFCFDMMLVVLCCKRNTGPGFLIHDSHLFDGMDGRQITKAIEIGERAARKYGFQYIVTLNSDMAPYEEFSRDFVFNDSVLPVVLTDATEDGGLFGFRFE